MKDSSTLTPPLSLQKEREKSEVSLLGIPIARIRQLQALEHISAFLQENRFHHVMTVNSEMLVESTKNPEFREILQKTALNLPESVGILWAARYTKQHLPERVTGVDTVTALCLELDEQHPVFFLGAAPGVVERAAKRLQEQNPRLRIAGMYAGSPHEEEAEDILRRINASGAHLLLVAFGAPQQDMWIARHAHALRCVRVAMGVGGTFDFIAGIQKRAPLWVRRVHCEWLWRLMLEPKRFGRIWRAVGVFPYLILRNKH